MISQPIQSAAPQTVIQTEKNNDPSPMVSATTLASANDARPSEITGTTVRTSAFGVPNGTPLVARNSMIAPTIAASHVADVMTNGATSDAPICALLKVSIFAVTGISAVGNRPAASASRIDATAADIPNCNIVGSCAPNAVSAIVRCWEFQISNSTCSLLIAVLVNVSGNISTAATSPCSKASLAAFVVTMCVTVNGRLPSKPSSTFSDTLIGGKILPLS